MTTRIIVIILVIGIQNGHSMPQGFLPKFASWNKNEGSLTILPNVKVDSPVKSSFLNVFGKKNTIVNHNKPKIEHYLISNDATKQGEVTKSSQDPLTSTNNDAGNINLETKTQVTNKELANVSKEEEQYISKLFTALNDNATDNQIDYTESTIETSTTDYESTTFEDGIFNRSNPQLVASLLG